MTKKQLQEMRQAALKKGEDIRLKYDGKPGEMTSTEEEEWSKAMDDVDSLQRKIDLLDREEKATEWGKTASNLLTLPGAGGGIIPGINGLKTLNDEEEAIRQGGLVFRRFLKSGLKSVGEKDLAMLGAVTSIKAYQADDMAGGGFLIAPQQFVASLITLVKDLVFIRAKATVFGVVKAESLGVPSLDVDPSDAEWTSELATGSEETTMAFGKRELRPHPVAKRLKLSNKLIRQSAINVESVVMDRLAYKFAVTEEKAFLTGDGAGKPLGIFTPSADGIPTSRDVTAAGAASLVGDDFIDTKYSLKAQYLMRAEWVINRSVIKAIRKLKDTTGNYLWTAGDGATGPGGGLQGSPDRLLDLPINMSEYAPGTIATGQYVAALGDYSNYWIADALDMAIQVLDQLYAETNQTGYICRKETDGMPVLPEAFARLKMA